MKDDQVLQDEMELLELSFRGTPQKYAFNDLNYYYYGYHDWSKPDKVVEPPIEITETI